MLVLELLKDSMLMLMEFRNGESQECLSSTPLKISSEARCVSAEMLDTCYTLPNQSTGLAFVINEKEEFGSIVKQSKRKRNQMMVNAVELRCRLVS